MLGRYATMPALLLDIAEILSVLPMSAVALAAPAEYSTAGAGPGVGRR